jgi:two-component system LytT family response regulator
MDKIKALIIDDEPLARALIKNFLVSLTDIEIIGECENGFEALKAIQEQNPGLLFLDIQMPKIDGFELLEVLEKKPVIIFTTAYDQYAIKAFEMNAVDYLLKPFSKERLLQAVEKSKVRLADPSAPDSKIDQLQQHLDDSDRIIDRIVTRMGSKVIVIPVDQIDYLEAQDDYVMIYSEVGRHLKEKTMKFFEQHLPRGSFLRIHRSYIVNVNRIAAVELYEKNTHLVTLKNGAKLRASQEGYKKLRDIF